jgi:hypothetical protein
MKTEWGKTKWGQGRWEPRDPVAQRRKDREAEQRIKREETSNEWQK